jgi:predicted acyl esterase
MGTMIDCGSGVRLERAVRCAMSDGVVLVSDHYYPPEAGPHPTLLMRQPYGRDIASTVVYAHPVWFASHNYNVVIQDVRGRGDSEGDFYPFRNEGRDGAETIRWLRTRPESNGAVGMYGFSYQGMTQLLAAAAARAALHRPRANGLRSLSRLVLSSGRITAGLEPGLGPADDEGRCAAAQAPRGQRRS